LCNPNDKPRWNSTPEEISLPLSVLVALRRSTNKNVGEIDIFLHDSDHSYQNMLWEFQTAWKYLKAGGLLLSHNIDANDAFSDFCQDCGIKRHSLTNMGGIVKA